MFNYSEIEASGRERLNAFQGEARHHELIKQVHGETGHSVLLRVISFIRPEQKLVNAASPAPTIARQPNPECA